MSRCSDGSSKFQDTDILRRREPSLSDESVASQEVLLRALLTHLAAPLQRLWELAPTYGAQKAQKAIDTFEGQVASFAQGIEAWQQWVTTALNGQTQDAARRNWVLSCLLPWVYWTQQADKTRQPSLKQRYQDTASSAFDPGSNSVCLSWLRQRTPAIE